MIYRLIYLLGLIAFCASFVLVQIFLPPVPPDSWPLVAFICAALIVLSVAGLALIAALWLDRSEKDHRQNPHLWG